MILAVPYARDWLYLALLASIALHLIAYAALQLRFSDDLERAYGAASSMVSAGTIVLPVEILIEAPLPSNLFASHAADLETKIDIPSPGLKEKESKLEVETERTGSVPDQPAVTESTSAIAAIIFEHSAGDSVQPRDQNPVIERRRPSRTHASVAANSAPSAASGSSGHAGSGGLAEVGGQAAVSSYQAKVLAHLSRYRIYPEQAQSRGVTGAAKVRFALAADGRVLSVSLAAGSGIAILDQAAVDMVRRASPFPPFPKDLGRTRLDFAAPIRFDLR